MPQPSTQNLLSASNGSRRVTVGCEPPELLRQLSDARELTCPGCGGAVVLHAGSVRAHHFAHLPGAVCSRPQSEPETEEHREGKMLIGGWLREQFPDGSVTIEAHLPATGQRADVLLEARAPNGAGRKVAVEFQCANLAAREWRRRHALYLAAGIDDLWILGASRCSIEKSPLASEQLPEEPATARQRHRLRTSELERALLAGNAALLFLDSVGILFARGTIARFRPDDDAQSVRPAGRISARQLVSLAFPWSILDRQPAEQGASVAAAMRAADMNPGGAAASSLGEQLWLWLELRFRVTPGTISALFGMQIPGQEVVKCEPRLWQAAVYYRFIHRRVGMGWWLPEVETWARAFLPLAHPLPLRNLQRVLRSLQDHFAAAGLLTLPVGHKRTSARIAADLESLSSPPDRDEAMRLARYRRTLDRP